MIKTKKSNRGFTLIELIVVMAIIAILVLLAAPRFLGYTKDANVTAMEQDTKVLSDAAEMYHLNKGEWPVTGEVITVQGIGGVDGLYHLDEADFVDSIKNISSNLEDYALSTKGKYKGQVFHLNGVEDKENYINYGGNKSTRQPIRFDGVEYENISVVPESPEGWFRTTLIQGGCQLDGFSDEIKTEGTPTKIRIPDQINGRDVITIADFKRGESDFKDIEELVLPNTLISIGDEAFRDNKIRELVIPNSVQTIGVYSFIGNRIDKLDLGSGIKTIKSGSFEFNRLREISFPNSIEYIGPVSFYSNQLEEIFFPNKYIDIMHYSFNDNNLPKGKSFIYARNPDGSLNKKKLLSYGGKEREYVKIPEGVEEIANAAFRNNLIKKVYIPDSVKSIGNLAFTLNRLTSVTIPKDAVYSENSFEGNNSQLKIIRREAKEELNE